MFVEYTYSGVVDYLKFSLWSNERLNQQNRGSAMEDEDAAEMYICNKVLSPFE